MVCSDAFFACLVLLVGASVRLWVGGREFAGKGQVAFKPEQSSAERPLSLRGVTYNQEVQEPGEVKGKRDGEEVAEVKRKNGRLRVW